MLAAMGQEAAVVIPSTNQPTVATNQAGACFAGSPDPSASITVDWTITNPSSDYRMRLYENDIQVYVADSDGVSSYDKEVTGFVQNGSGGPWNADWTYRVDVERKSDSAVVSTQTSATWTQAYGSCT